MFPFSGSLSSIAAGNCYSRRDVEDILAAARGSELDVIPLVQTFGHVEFALKHPEFAELREVPESPQALCPSFNASMEFVEKMIEQVRRLNVDGQTCLALVLRSTHLSNLNLLISILGEVVSAWK